MQGGLRTLIKKMRNRIDVLRADMLDANGPEDNVRNGKLGNDFLPWDEKLNVEFGLKPFAMLTNSMENLFKGENEFSFQLPHSKFDFLLLNQTYP